MILFILFCTPKSEAQTVSNIISYDSLTSGEKEIYWLINEYRQSRNLPPVTYSPSLSYVARVHAQDQTLHHVYKSKCTLHSWSSDGAWSSCCYTADHKYAECMWNKPRELTTYTGDGFEISFFSTFKYATEADFAADALAGWKKSPGHNNVIVNLSQWKNTTWKAMGVGIHGNYINVWFGKEEDK